jgi:hypothetical protein
MGIKKLLLPLLAAVLIAGLAGAAWAEARIHIVVKTVLASHNSTFLDPGIPALTQKL